MARSNWNHKISRLSDLRNERLAKVAALYITGRYTMRQMAQMVGEITVQQIRRDLFHIRRMWEESANQDVKFYLSKELARLDAVEAEAWRSFQESKGAQTESSKEVVIDAEGDITTKRAKKRKKGVGDASFLALILGCVDRRVKLLGLAERNVGDADDIQIQAIEVICHNREQAKAMIEFEEFRSTIKR